MVNVRPNAGLLDTGDLVRGGLLGNLGTTLLGYDPRAVAAGLFAGTGNPFGFVDQPGSGRNPIAPTGEGLPSLDASRGEAAYRAPVGTPAGMLPVALPPLGPPPSGLMSVIGKRVGGLPPSVMLHPPFAGPVATAERQRQPYASLGSAGNPLPMASDEWPVSDDQRPTLAPAADPSIVRIAGGDPAIADDEVQIAQQQGNNPPTPQRPQLPGRGYGTTPQSQIERGMTREQIGNNRDQAFGELARQPLPTEWARRALPDDWESTKPADLVTAIKRAGARHGVPTKLLARLLYQEGKFNEADQLDRPLVMDAPSKTQPLGYAQMTKQTLEELKRRAQVRGDLAREGELLGSSLANPSQSFDAAAEQLAYLYRFMGGSWPKAVAAYNTGPHLVRWFNGGVGDDFDPRFFGRPRDKDGKLIPDKKTGKIAETDKWKKEIPTYLRFILRGDAENSDLYRIPVRLESPPEPSDVYLNP